MGRKFCLGVMIFSLAFLFNGSMLFELNALIDTAFRRVKTPFQSSAENMPAREEKFPLDPKEGAWAGVPTQDTH